MSKRIFISVATMVVVLLGVIASGLKKSPDITTISAEAYELYLQGVDHNQNFYQIEAVEVLEKAIELDEEFAMAYLELSFSYQIKGDYIKSRQLIEKASLFKDFVTEREALIIDIRKNSGAEFNPAAADSLNDILYNKYGNTIEPHLYKARAFVREKDILGAISEYEMIIKIDPGFAPVYNTLGYLYANEGENEKAVTNLKKYAKLSPGKANPHDSLGEILIRVGRFQEAVESLNMAIELKPDLITNKNFLGAAVAKNLGNAHLGKGEITKAINYFDLAEEINPSENVILEAQTNKYFALLLARRNEEFNSYSEGMWRLKSNDQTKPHAYLIQGIYYILNDDINAAKEEYDKLGLVIDHLSVDNDRAKERLLPVLGLLEAEIQLREGKYSEAVNTFKTKCYLTEDVKKSDWVNWRFSNAYRLEGDYQNSEKLVKDFLETNPNSFLMRSVRVQSYFDQGEYKKAKSELKAVKELLKDADSDLSILTDMNKIEGALEVLL